MIGIKQVAVIAAISLAAAPLWLVGQNAAWAQAALQYRVGDRVAAPIGAQFFDSVIVQVIPNPPSYRVHPLGFLSTADFTANPQMLRAPGSVKTEPVGGIANDPYLLAAQGKKAFHPTMIYPGGYECSALSGGHLEARLLLNFTIVDAERYRDHAGTTGSYRFDAASGTLVFKGGTLDGQRATYTQASDPPTGSQPPSITLAVSGDTCQRRI